MDDIQKDFNNMTQSFALLKKNLDDYLQYLKDQEEDMERQKLLRRERCRRIMEQRRRNPFKLFILFIIDILRRFI